MKDQFIFGVASWLKKLDAWIGNSMSWQDYYIGH
jgi:hypothetical protein